MANAISRVTGRTKGRVSSAATQCAGVEMTGKRTYDLAERTATFAEAAIALAKALPRNAVTLPLIGQMVRSATSVGANICEANDAVSRKDFRNKVGICRKEANETKYWLRMIATAVPESAARARALWKEAHELHLIFAKSFTTAGRPPGAAPSPENGS